MLQTTTSRLQGNFLQCCYTLDTPNSPITLCANNTIKLDGEANIVNTLTPN